MAGDQKDRTLNVAIVVVAICALTMTSMAAYRSFRPPRPVEPPVASEISNWQRFGAIGNRLGPANAEVTIVEFSDFQCSFCKTAATTLKATRAKYEGRVAVVYRHYPLERIHPLARQAAIASECAAQQSSFERYHDALFAQDSLKPRGWVKLARHAGILDTIRFAACLKDPAAEGLVDRDVLQGAELKVTGTPTILVNQYLLTGGAKPEVIDSLVQLLLRSN